MQDNWRVTPKLTLNLGLRMEYEMGPTERYDRMIGTFDPSIAIPLEKGAEANYARSPIPELPASRFQVAGGNVYAGQNGASRRLYSNEFMWLPRFGAAYSLDSKTVIRGGYGIFYDTINVLNFGPNQAGYSRSTNPIITNDFGQRWNFPSNANPANGNSPLVDPFPVRADGTRFDTPPGNALGSNYVVGRGYDYTGFNQPHARQQRWQAGVQRQLGKDMVMTAMYVGSYSDRISLQTRTDYLPQQFWATGLVRNDTIANNLNSNVTNPFYIANLNQADFPALVWADMQTNSFFTSPTIRKHQLLRNGTPQNTGGNGLRNTKDFDYFTRTHEIQLSFEKRFSAGWNLSTSYTGMMIREADYLYDEWDQTPSERISNDGRPHRFIITGIYELPFGKGRRLASNISRGLDMLIGGWQMASTYEWQPGPLTDWGNRFYYGSDVNDVANIETKTFDKWFNTANFETANAKAPNSFHARIFPYRIDGIRRMATLQWNANVSKNIRLAERVNMQLRFDALNVLNRSQMEQPNTDPFSTNFGRITSQTSAMNRWLQVQARIQF
jgi:hypothetical protein